MSVRLVQSNKKHFIRSHQIYQEMQLQWRHTFLSWIISSYISSWGLYVGVADFTLFLKLFWLWSSCKKSALEPIELAREFLDGLYTAFTGLFRISKHKKYSNDKKHNTLILENVFLIKSFTFHFYFCSRHFVNLAVKKM